MVRVARLAVVATLVGVLTACSADDGSGPPGEPAAASSSATAGAEDEHFQPTDDDRQQIRALLKARGTALQDGDRAAFLATIDTQDAAFVRQQETLFANLEALPVESVRYSVDDGAGYPTAKVKGDDPLFRPAVLEQVRLDVDAAPVTNTLENTFVRRDGTWLLGAESVPGKYRDDREPQSRPWAGTVPIEVAHSGGLVIVVDGRLRGEAQGLADQLVEDIDFDAQALGIAPSYDVLVDATTVGETHAMSTVGDTDAAAVTFPVTYFDNADNARLAGIRIKVNPETAGATIADTIGDAARADPLPDPAAARRRAHVGEGGARRVGVDRAVEPGRPGRAGRRLRPRHRGPAAAADRGRAGASTPARTTSSPARPSPTSSRPTAWPRCWPSPTRTARSPATTPTRRPTTSCARRSGSPRPSSSPRPGTSWGRCAGGEAAFVGFTGRPVKLALDG